MVATTGAHYARPDGGRLAAAMAAVRARRSLDEADPYLPPGAGAHLRSGAEMAQLFARYPDAVANAQRIGLECAFDLRLVAPQLPPFDVPAATTRTVGCANSPCVARRGGTARRTTTRAPTGRSTTS